MLKFERSGDKRSCNVVTSANHLKLRHENKHSFSEYYIVNKGTVTSS